MIQVCYDMSAAKTHKREVESLVECAGELRCSSLSIITWNQEETIEKDGYTIKVVPLRKWILEASRSRLYGKRLFADKIVGYYP